eukprot:CAMPEP_0179064762 /NCGR_PEP_ID=MMETSP0796-20121207/28111_1 /TAXON_ID=73915 /ORGANISM="Pyrodinium bahamense, Strain pbaha01" /LENGTH=126 /DNA_ID=CAMNT_0020761711 /DNA_START=49 /DNA_END=429 /DNA_ORIENTATION=+
MALLAAAGACSAPCAGTIAAITGGTLAGPAVTVAAVATAVALPLAKRALQGLRGENEADAAESDTSKDEAAGAARIATTVAASTGDACARAARLSTTVAAAAGAPSASDTPRASQAASAEKARGFL